jgi:hydroxyacylglutathione hydrolase
VRGFILLDDYAGERKTVAQMSVNEVDELARNTNNIQFVDVRRSAEHNSAHAPGTVNIPLDKLEHNFEMLDPDLPTYVICQGGYRSSIGTSILENAGFTRLHNVTGGTAAWIAAGLETDSSVAVCGVTAL